jgi:hypothetical protein
MPFKNYCAFIFVLSLIGCSPEVGKQYIKPDDIKEIKQDKPIGKFTPPKVDILFVIDDSGSMGSYQQALSTNLPIFINEFTTKTDIDYNISVINSSCDGQCGYFLGSTKVINKLTPNGINILKQNLVVGTDGDIDEKFMDPIMAALSTNLLNGVNKNFLRKKVPLVVIFITDTEDKSRVTAKQAYQDLLKVKDNKPYDLLAYGVYIPDWEMSNPNCKGESERPLRLQEFLGYFSNATPPLSPQGNTYLICGAFGTKLGSIGQDIANRVSRIYLLNDAPAKGTIEVRYGNDLISQDEMTGWVYDIGRNAVIIGPDFKWDPPGSTRQISVKYEIATLVNN